MRSVFPLEVPQVGESAIALLRYLFRYGTIDDIRVFQEKGVLLIPSPLVNELLEEAAHFGRLDIIRHVHQSGGDVISISAVLIAEAICYDHADILQYLHQNGFRLSRMDTSYFLSLCYENLSFKCFYYLSRCSGFLTERNPSIEDFVFSKTIEVLKEHPFRSFSLFSKGFLFEENKKWERKDLFEFTKINCIFGNDWVEDISDYFQKLSENEREKCLKLAVENGNVDFVRSIVECCVDYLDDEIGIDLFEGALINNRENVIDYFLSKSPKFLDDRNVVKRLIKNSALFLKISMVERIRNHYNIVRSSNVRPKLIDIYLLYFSALHNRFDMIRYLHEHIGVPLRLFLKVNTDGIAEGPLRTFLADRRYLNELKKDIGVIDSMKGELIQGEKIFQPSRFWDFFNDVNIIGLKESGFKNFKRSVNQNYFNFVPIFFADWFFISILFLKLKGLIKTTKDYVLVDPDRINDKGDLKVVYRRVFQKNRKLQLWLYSFTIKNLWNYIRGHDPENLLQTLEEPRLGNPIEIRDGQKLISQDLANSVQEYYFIKPHIEKIAAQPIKIVEIGAGYGRVGYVFLKALNCKYIVFDIPPALYISQKYLSELFPDKKTFKFRKFENFEDIREELEESDIAFFTINQIKYFPEEYVNLCVNISSLHEMRKDQAQMISDYMSKIAKDFIYIKQYKKYKNPIDNIVVKEKNYKFSGAWERICRRTTPTNIRFFEMVFQKKTSTA